MVLTAEKLRNVLSYGNDINIFISDRGGRKSSAAQMMLIDDALNGNPFVLLRSKKDETISENWLSEYVQIECEKRGLVFYSERISNNIEQICFNDENGKKYVFCFGLWLSLAEKYKSNYFKGWEKVKYILWEECVPTAKIPTDNVNYIVQRYSEQLKNILSIGSTITRRNHAQFIFFGNDIQNNIINAITVNFNVLERLSANCEINDTALIDGRTYSFYFSYFDFDGAVNHWLENPFFDISQVDTKGAPALNYCLVSEFRNYHIFNMGKYLYIGTDNADTKTDFCINEKAFFKKYDAEHLLDEYSVGLALQLLIKFYNAKDFEIREYFGDNWYHTPKFSPPQKTRVNSLINIFEISQMKRVQIINLKNFSDILTLRDILKNNTIVYENIAIKLYCARLLDMLILEQ